MSKHRLTRGSVRRSLALSAAGAMVFALTPVQSAFATHVDGARDIDEAGDVCENPEDAGFDDIAADRIEQAANCLNELGIALGFPDGTYRPGQTITREQMASFLARKLKSADQFEVDNTPPSSDFNDREQIADPHLNNVDIVAFYEIALGRDNGDFDPAGDVTRGQMAAFLVRQIETITGDDLEPQENHFTDDEGHWAEEFINIIADLGLAEGTAPGVFEPNESVTRGQMALFVARDVDALNNEFGITFTALEDGERPATNQTFTVTPAEDTTLEEGDQQQVTVTGITSDTVDLALFECGDVTVANDGTVSFADADDNNQADFAAGDTDAVITVVNGVDVADSDHINDVSANNGTVTFTVTSSSTECVVALAFDDADDDNALDVDDDGAPTEAFGVGGQLQFIPAEAAGGPFDVDVVLVNTAEDFFVGTDNANTGATNEGTFFYDSNDSFTVDGAPATMATFEANLSAGDEVGGTYATDPSLSSQFNLRDLAPANPTALTATQGTPSDTVIDLDWTASATTTVDAYRIYSNDEACANTTVSELGLIATVDDSETDHEVTGLTPSTTYCFVVTAVDDNDESTLAVGTAADGDDNTAQETTSAAVDAPIITSATLELDAPLEGIVDDGDEWELVFNEEMDTASVEGATFDLTDADGDTFRVECDADSAVDSTSDFITDADCLLVDGDDADGDLDTLQITLLEDAEDRNAAGDAGTTGGGIEYPVTITATDGITDADDGAEPDISASTDVTIG